MKLRMRNERGQATVEFALILPLLLFLLLGIIELAKAWNLSQVATDAVREGTRRCVIADAAITKDMVEVDIKNRMAAAGVPAAASQVEFTPNDATACDASTLPVTITLRVGYSWMFLRPVLKPITLVSSFTMRNE